MTSVPSVGLPRSKITRMRNLALRGAVLSAVLALPVLVLTQAAQEPAISARAKQLHERAIVIDSHDDTTQRLLSDKTFDISKRN